MKNEQSMAVKEPIRKIIDEIEQAWNQRNMDLFASFYSEDANYITITGLRLESGEAIKDEHTATHETIFRSSHLKLSDPDIRLLKEDVAVVHVPWELSDVLDPEGKPMPPFNGIVTHVMLRTNNHWVITTTHNTRITYKLPNE